MANLGRRLGETVLNCSRQQISRPFSLGAALKEGEKYPPLPQVSLK